MSLINIKMPTGMTPSKEELMKLTEGNRNLQRAEMNADVVTIYKNEVQNDTSN